MSMSHDPQSTASYEARAVRLDRALADLLAQAPDLEAAAVVSFDGLAMASVLPVGMDEDRVAAMSAALLSLGEKAAQGLGRGDLSQVYIEGDNGTVYLISAEDEAVLVAVACKGAKAGLMLFEVRRSAAVVGRILGEDAPEALPEVQYLPPVEPVRGEPMLAAVPDAPVAMPMPDAVLVPVAYEPAPFDPAYYEAPAAEPTAPQLVPDLAPVSTWSPYSAEPAGVPAPTAWT